MSDILIKNMKMPKSCYTCQFGDNYEGSFCLATNDEHHIDHMTAIRRRPKWCPLVEVKPHGRLIDADEHMRVLEQMPKDAVDDVQRESFAMAHMLICLAPTVLGASNG